MIVNKKREIRTDQRRKIVASMLLRAPKITQREIRDRLADEGFYNPDTKKPYALGTINADVKYLQEQWREEAQENIALWKGLQVEQINEVIREAWKSKDLNNVLKAIKMQSDIIGTNAALKLEHTGANAEPIRFIIKRLDGQDN